MLLHAKNGPICHFEFLKIIASANQAAMKIFLSEEDFHPDGVEIGNEETPLVVVPFDAMTRRKREMLILGQIENYNFK